MSKGDFLSFLHKNDPSYTEEQQLEAYKNYKSTAQTVSVDELEDDDFYNDEVPEINEAHRTQRPSPRPAPRPAPAPAPTPAPCPAPMPAEPDFDDDNYVEPAPVRRRTKKPQSIVESAGYINNPAFSEAFSLIDEMKEKMTAMFFKYGMTGLEKLNECMLDMCDEIMNPPPPAPKIIYKEKEPEVVVAPPAPVKKTVVKKKPAVAKTEKVAEAAAVPQVTKPRVVKKAEPAKSEEEILKQKKANLDAMLETADLSELGSTLTKQSSVQVDEGAKRLALVQANSERIKKLSEEKKEAQQKIEESNEPVEEFEVVADGESTFEMPSAEENTTTNAELETAAN